LTEGDLEFKAVFKYFAACERNIERTDQTFSRQSRINYFHEKKSKISKTNCPATCLLSYPEFLFAKKSEWCSLWGFKFCMSGKILRQAVLFSSTAILGPILLFGGIGYILDNHFGTGKLFLLISIGLAFILTNILMLKKFREFSKISNIYVEQAAFESSDGKP
jgi:hypothetical protein